MSVFLFNKSIWKNGWKDFIVLIDLQLSGRVSWLRSGCLNSEHSCALSYFTLPNALHFGNRLICDIICTAKFNFLIQWQLSGKWPKSNDHACVRWPHLSQSISINLNLIDPWIMAVMPACLPSYATLFAGQIKLCSLNHCNHTYFQKKKKKKIMKEKKKSMKIEIISYVLSSVNANCAVMCTIFAERSIDYVALATDAIRSHWRALGADHREKLHKRKQRFCQQFFCSIRCECPSIHQDTYLFFVQWTTTNLWLGGSHCAIIRTILSFRACTRYKNTSQTRHRRENLEIMFVFHSLTS